MSGEAATSPAPELLALGETAWLLRLGTQIDPMASARVLAVHARLLARRPAWLVDSVPAYASLAVHLSDEAAADADRAAAAAAELRSLVDDLHACRPEAARTVEIPVRYGGVDGPDLDAVAAHAGLSAEEVVRRHAAAEYRVAMLGFAPGFPYLLGLDPALATPRLDRPRRRVEGGSVGIGGAQTGIYPGPGPGGWRIIGRTPAVLFDPGREAPTRLEPGDRVRFVPVA